MTLEEMTAVVCDDRPKLLDLITRGKNLSLLTYYKKTLLPKGEVPVECKEVVFKSIVRCLANAGITIDEQQYKKEFFTYYTATTADHHGPLCHPFFSNNTFLESIVSKQTEQSTITHLACSGTSLDNSSYPRGFLIHNSKGVLVRIPFLSLKEHRKPVYGLMVTQSQMHRHATTTFQKVQNEFEPAVQKKILLLLNTLFDRENNTLEQYSDFIPKINEKLWQTLYGNTCRLLTIDQESVVREILLETIGEKGVLNDILFDPEKRAGYIAVLNGAVGAATKDKERGTELFWYVGQKARERMTIRENALHSESGVTIPLTEKALYEALVKRSIYPNMALSFTVLCFIYGLRTGGGFCQINYLPEILRRVENWSGARSRLTEIDATLFRGEYTFLPFEIGGVVVEATPLDVLVYAPHNWQKMLADKAATASLAHGLYGMMDEFYKITTGEKKLAVNNPRKIPLWHVTN